MSRPPSPLSGVYKLPPPQRPALPAAPIGVGAAQLVAPLLPQETPHPLVRPTPGAAGMLAVHLYVDVRDAMGANLVNTIAEAVAPRLAELAVADIGLRILSNLSDRRCVRVTCRVPAHCLATGAHAGELVRDGIVAASRFAELDPYRAATHNKGIMNGVDAVVMATGNDWRGVEAGAHAFAATKAGN